MVAGSAQQTHLQEQRLLRQRNQEELEIQRQQRLNKAEEEVRQAELRQHQASCELRLQQILSEQEELLSKKPEEERQASQRLQQLISQNRGLQRTDALSSSAATTVLHEVMEAFSLTPTTAATTSAATTATSEIVPCCHGSTSDHFSDGISYRSVIDDFSSLLGSVEGRTAFIDYHQSHSEYFTDLNFAHYIFALGTSWYLKTNQVTIEMEELLELAIGIKYLYFYRAEVPDYDKYNRYIREIRNEDERVVINCLSRETRSYCDCMEAKKKEAAGMEKRQICYGCDNIFPRDNMKKCSGCKCAMFCTTEGCYEKYWPKHKASCQGLQKVHAKITGL